MWWNIAKEQQCSILYQKAVRSLPSVASPTTLTNKMTGCSGCYVNAANAPFWHFSYLTSPLTYKPTQGLEWWLIRVILAVSLDLEFMPLWSLNDCGDSQKHPVVRSERDVLKNPACYCISEVNDFSLGSALKCLCFTLSSHAYLSAYRAKFHDCWGWCGASSGIKKNTHTQKRTCLIMAAITYILKNWHCCYFDICACRVL